MISAVKLKLLALHRNRIGFLDVKNIKQGKYVKLDENIVNKLKKKNQICYNKYKQIYNKLFVYEGEEMVKDSEIKAKVSPFAIKEGEIKQFDGYEGYVSIVQITNKIDRNHITELEYYLLNKPLRIYLHK